MNAGRVAISSPPEFFLLGSTRIKLLVESAATGGDLAICDGTMPAGDRTPLHVHAEEHETFIVLEGRGRFLVGEQMFELGPGESATAPPGISHAYRVLDDESARWLIVVTGRVGFDGFVRELGRPVDGPPLPEPPLERIAAVGARHGIEILGPPPPALD